MRQDGVKKPRKDENKKHHTPAYMRESEGADVESLVKKNGHSVHQ